MIVEFRHNYARSKSAVLCSGLSVDFVTASIKAKRLQGDLRRQVRFGSFAHVMIRVRVRVSAGMALQRTYQH